MAKIKVGVIFGGKSGEHEVSRVSASYVINAIDKKKYTVKTIGITKKGEWLLYEGPVSDIANGRWEAKAKKDLKENPKHFAIQILGCGGKNLKNVIDFALPILHGPNGEDGTVQGLLELINIPYGGCGVLGCAVTMDKIVAKEIFANAGLPQTPYIALTSNQIGKKTVDEINKKLKYPLFVKPANMGSSVGITKVKDKKDLMAALKLAAKYDERLVVEQGVDCLEIETAIMGNDKLITGVPGEIVPAAEFYDYDAKYNNAESKTLVPAKISKEKQKEVLEMAKIAYKACGCSGFVRADFMLDKKTQKFYINEINAIPGFTSISMFPMMMQKKGLSYAEIIDKIIDYGYERYNAKNNR
ncbi:MAG: D-alanine--D-alanine ligase [Clostridia bacterium]|nr:D-alanine--D-alanine ligase [Clostridia bacterium]